MITENALNAFIRHADKLYKREYLINLFTTVKFDEVKLLTGSSLSDEATIKSELAPGSIVIPELNPAIKKYNIFLVDSLSENDPGVRELISIKTVDIKDTDPIYSFDDEFTLTKGMIANYNGDPIITTIGRYVLNYLILSKPFNGKIPYVNELWSIDTINKLVSNHITKEGIVKEQFDEFMNNQYFLCHFAELAVPVFSKKALTTGDNVLAKKKELLLKYKDKNLKDPIVAGEIEDALIKLDKQYLSGDESVGFLKAQGDASFDIHRKKMHLMTGIIEGFDADTISYDFMETSLAEGWDKTKFPSICDEIRRGSYNRAKATAKGGELTKFVGRIFQNKKITDNNCGSVEGIPIILTEKLFKTLSNDGRYIVMPNGDSIPLTDPKYIGKKVILRSPQYCLSEDGHCFICCGDRYRNLDARAIGMEAIAITSTFLTQSLKNMHGTKITTYKIDNVLEHCV